MGASKNEAACGGLALTVVLGDLADKFECHALSRSIDDIEAAGRAMRAAKAEIEQMRSALDLCEMALTEWDNEGLAKQAKKAIYAAIGTPMARLYGCCAEDDNMQME